jgi:hypothetical protein
LPFSSDIFGHFRTFSYVFRFLFLPQTAIRQINRQRAERLKLPFHPDQRAFAYFAFDNNFGIAQTIRKYNEAGFVARLNHQLALSVPLYQLPNFSRNIHSRANGKS